MKSDICPNAEDGVLYNLHNIDQLTGYPFIYRNSQDDQQFVAKSDISVSPPKKNYLAASAASFASRPDHPSNKSKSLVSLGSRHFSKGDIEENHDYVEPKEITPISAKDNTYAEGVDAGIQCS